MIHRYTLFYCSLFILSAVVYRYDRWVNLPPVSIHQWRQADGQALAEQYALEGNFFEPRIYNLFYTGDHHAVGELPLLYWLAGKIGEFDRAPEYPLRWLGLILLFAAGWVFGYMILERIGRPLASALAALLLLSSPILAYYGPSFLPDVPAFCFIVFAAAGWLRYHRSGRMIWLAAAVLCLVTGVLFKLSAAVFPLALMLAWYWERREGRLPSQSLQQDVQIIAGILVALILVGSFRAWIARYNDLHGAFYFLSATRPIWNYDGPFIIETLKQMLRFGMPAIASVGLYAGLFASLAIGFFKKKSEFNFYDKILIFNIIGAIFFILLWFRMLREHDYYFICLMPFAAYLIWRGLECSFHFFSEKKILLFLSACFLSGLLHCGWLLQKRYQLAMLPENNLNLPPEAFLEPGILLQAGIPAEARILCPEDPSPNIALTALHHTGWTAYNFVDCTNADTLSKYRRQFDMRYLAIRNKDLYNDGYHSFFPRLVFEGRGWYIFGP